MPRLTAHVDEPTKARWTALAEQQGMTESALLMAVVGRVLNQSPPAERLDLGEPGEKMFLRLRRKEERAIREAAVAAGLSNRQAWVIALIRAKLFGVPTPSSGELEELRESNRQLAAIGRNLNQLAHAVNIDFRHRTSLTGETLTALRAAIDRQQSSVTRLVRGTLHRWTGRDREDGDDE